MARLKRNRDFATNKTQPGVYLIHKRNSARALKPFYFSSSPKWFSANDLKK